MPKQIGIEQSKFDRSEDIGIWPNVFKLSVLGGVKNIENPREVDDIRIKYNSETLARISNQIKTFKDCFSFGHSSAYHNELKNLSTIENGLCITSHSSNGNLLLIAIDKEKQIFGLRSNNTYCVNDHLQIKSMLGYKSKITISVIPSFCQGIV